MEGSGGSLRALTTKITEETSLDYDILAKIQSLHLVLGSKAFALALLTRIESTAVDQLFCPPCWNSPVQNPHSVNVTSACVIHFRVRKRIGGLHADCM